MTRLVGQLERRVSEAGDEVTVVFEGPPSAPIVSRTVEVVHAPRALPDAADDEIVRRLAGAQERAAIRVVTSDRRLAERVRQAGAAVEPAGAFRALVDAARGSPH